MALCSPVSDGGGQKCTTQRLTKTRATMSKLWTLIIKIVVVLLMVAAIVIMAIALKKQGDNNRRLKANMEAELSGDKSVQQEYTVREFKEYFDDEMKLLKEHGVPARNVENIVKVSYIYRDTTIYRDTLIYIYDTIYKAQRADFCVETECFNVEGHIVGDTLEINDISAFDEVTVALYKEKKKCLFERRKIKAIAISGCTGDTLAVLRNLKVVK